jgi:hypothetical protein
MALGSVTSSLPVVPCPWVLILNMRQLAVDSTAGMQMGLVVQVHLLEVLVTNLATRRGRERVGGCWQAEKHSTGNRCYSKGSKAYNELVSLLF